MVDVIDGDTVKVAMVTGPVRTVRLLGIDSPETKDPRKGEQCWGQQATEFAQNTVGGKAVLIQTDPTQDATDQYGRQLAYVILANGTDYSVLAAGEGAARAYTYRTPVQRAPQIVAAQEQAQAAGRGLWGPPCSGAIQTAPAIPPETTASSPETQTVVPPAPSVETPPQQSGGSVYYAKCADAKKAGAAPLHQGDSGYSPKLDRDGDGVACEK